MDTIVGFAMLLFFLGYGSYAFVAKDFNYDFKFALQMIVSLAGSIYLLVWPNLSKLKSLFTFKQRKEGDVVIEPVAPSCNKSCDKLFCKLLEGKDLQDYAALVYLKDRAKELNSQELMDLVVKINTLLFAGSLQQDKQ